jgi:hypothetical protein
MTTTALLRGPPAPACARSARRPNSRTPPPQQAALSPRPTRPRQTAPRATPPDAGATAVVGADDGPAPSPEAAVDIAASPPTTPPTATEWQLDFSSRPVLDDRGKKVWELLVCDGSGDWVHAQYLPSNRINSTQVREGGAWMTGRATTKKRATRAHRRRGGAPDPPLTLLSPSFSLLQLKLALEALLAMPGAVRPETVRFFRGGMQTIITRALTDLGVRPVPSRRCYALSTALAHRAAAVYPALPGYDAAAAARPPFALELGAPGDLPDALRGEAWSFVQLPWGDLQAELGAVARGEAFGSTFDPAAASPALAASLTPTTPIPGVAVYSRRAEPLAAWTGGYEVAALAADTDRGCLVLETGVSARWRYAALGRAPADAAEARAWEEAKAGTGGLHFLVVQEGDGEEEVAGLWLLWDAPPPAA